MKDNSIGDIANKLNVSKSTVSKAIRHCGGVDSETRQCILKESRRINYCSDSDYAIYAILPDVPRYFWKELKLGIKAGEQLEIAPVKYNIYTKPSDEETVLEYLEDAENVKARVIIIAAYITSKIQQKLEKMTDRHLVILLSEQYEIKNSFYVGGDAYSDGYIMGKQYLFHYSDRRLILFSIQDNINAQKRMEGFCRAVEEEAPYLIECALYIEIKNEMISKSKLLPSKLAFALSEMEHDNLQICIYSPLGMLQLPLGVIKAKLSDKAVCLCHDCFSEYQRDVNRIHTGFAVTCNQDVFQQGLTAVKVATDYVLGSLYPNQKKIFVPSYICGESVDIQME